MEGIYEEKQAAGKTTFTQKDYKYLLKLLLAARNRTSCKRLYLK